MNPQTLLLIAAGIYLAARYVSPAFTVWRTEFSYHSFDIISVQSDYIRASVTMRADNPSGISYVLQKIDAGMTLNGKPIGVIKNVLNLNVPAKGSELVKIIFDIRKKDVGKELWSMIINKQTEFKFVISGKAWLNGNVYPMVLTWTMDDIIDIVNPKKKETTVIDINSDFTVPGDNYFRDINKNDNGFNFKSSADLHQL